MKILYRTFHLHDYRSRNNDGKWLEQLKLFYNLSHWVNHELSDMVENKNILSWRLLQHKTLSEMHIRYCVWVQFSRGLAMHGLANGIICQWIANGGVADCLFGLLRWWPIRTSLEILFTFSQWCDCSPITKCFEMRARIGEGWAGEDNGRSIRQGCGQKKPPPIDCTRVLLAIHWLLD